MYLEFYGLAEAPFSLTSDPRFVYSSRAFAVAWADVVRAIEQRQGVVVITGDSGVGKSVLCRALVEKLGVDTYLSPIANSRVSGDEFLAQVLADFDVAEIAALPPAAHAIILIDEAQHLTLAVVDQLRFLTNAERDGGKRVQVLLVGPPELRSRLQQPLLRALKQRVACWAALTPLEPDEVGPYLASRLDVARGGAAAAAVNFTPPAVAEIAVASQGNPRLVNVIADRALEIGHARGLRSIDRRTARAAIARAGVGLSARSGLTALQWAAVGTLIAAIAAGALWWQRARRQRDESPAAAISQRAPVTRTASRITDRPPLGM
jgi:general secretion pathway protein A